MVHKDGRFLGWTAIALALVGSTWIAAHHWSRIKTYRVDQIEVTGSARRRIVSDLIVWEASLTTRAADRFTAYRDLKPHVDKTLAYLKERGLKPEEIRVQSATTEALTEVQVTGHGEDRVEKTVEAGYRTSQVIQVTSTRVADVERISREVTSLIESGVPVESGTPSYFYTKLGELKIEMLAEASKDARVRAERILGSAGNAAPGRLRQADMGVINVNPANSTQTSWDGNNDTTALDKDIITIVHVTFDIDANAKP
jgi:uncharacterized protein